MDITTSGTEYRASVFIKTVFKATFGFPDMNHVNNIESVASNVRFDFMVFTRIMKSVFRTAVFRCRGNYGGADFTCAPKRTGRIITTRCFSLIGP